MRGRPPSLVKICIIQDESRPIQYGYTAMGFAVRVRSAGQKYGPTCHQRDRADVTGFVTLVRLSSLGQHVGVLALAGYKRRKSALTAGPIYNGVRIIRTSVRKYWAHVARSSVGKGETPSHTCRRMKTDGRKHGASPERG